MNQQLYVLLYSKYSPNSVNLLNYISSASINLRNTIGLNLLCIDNEDVRQRIKNTKAIQISLVPSVLVVYPTGGVEKYEGVNAFKWIEETIESFLPDPEPEKQEIQEDIILKSEPLDKKDFTPPIPSPKEPIIPQADKIIDLDRDKQQEEAINSIKKGNDVMAQAMAMQKERGDN